MITDQQIYDYESNLIEDISPEEIEESIKNPESCQ